MSDILSPFESLFHQNGINMLVDSSFSKLKIFSDRPDVVQGYYICENTTQIVCVKGMILLVVCDICDYNIEEVYIGESNRFLATIKNDQAFAWMNVTNDNSIVITDMEKINMQIDPVSEEKQVLSIGFAIPYKF